MDQSSRRSSEDLLVRAGLGNDSWRSTGSASVLDLYGSKDDRDAIASLGQSIINSPPERASLQSAFSNSKSEKDEPAFELDLSDIYRVLKEEKGRASISILHANKLLINET